jgi:glutaminyl-tRNA synthetase
MYGKEEDIAPGGQYEGMTVHTRFPPEPNGYLHIGHCKALCIDFGTAEKFGGLCNLRMDDTNPAKEDTEYVDAIQEDIHWLGFDWGDRFFYASDYFDKTTSTRGAHQKGPGLCVRADAGAVQGHTAATSAPRRPPTATAPWRKASTCSERMKNGEFEEGK